MRRLGSVLVIGGGPAGLSASVNLSAAGFGVTLIEHGTTGRLVGDQPVWSSHSGRRRNADALPYVALGADRATITLLDQLGTVKRVQFSRALHYEFYAKLQRITRLRRPPAPASLRAVLSLAAFPLLSLQDRRRILSFLERTWEEDPPLALDLESRTADRWLEQIGQSDRARRLVWGPLGRFLLGDDLSFVSARLFADTMKRCFLSSVRNSMLALPSEGLADLLVEPALLRLRHDRLAGHRSTPVKLLRFDTQRVKEIELQDGNTLTADWYVLDVPPHEVTALLPERILARYAYFQQIGQLQDVPMLTVHLWTTDKLMAPRLLLLADQRFHWLTSRKVSHNGRMVSLVSLVASGSGMGRERSDPILVQAAIDLVVHAFGLKTPPDVLHSAVVRTPRAYLAARPGTSACRPLQQSPVPNLLVSGSWTDTTLPSTLESAIRSGNLCAEAIVARSRKSAC